MDLAREPLEPVLPTAEPSPETDTTVGTSRAAQPLRALIWHRFRRNRIGMFGLIMVGGLYLAVLPAEFLAPYTLASQFSELTFAPPQRVHFVDPHGRFSLRPFVYGLHSERDPRTLRLVTTPNTAQQFRLRLLVRGEEYRWLLFRSRVHLFGVEEGYFFLLGTDRVGRDLFTRILYGGRISMTVGLLGVVVSVALGSFLGILSGYFGGLLDDLMQRGVELLISIPTLPLWLVLAAAVPPEWSPLLVFFMITLILSLASWLAGAGWRGRCAGWRCRCVPGSSCSPIPARADRHSEPWGGLAREVRGLALSLRSREFVLAARAAGARDGWILLHHLLPSCSSHIIVRASLAIPGMILGETSLSFLGLGIRPPMTSWGVLLQEAQRISVLAHHPWLVLPVFLVIIAILGWNFLGDGIRDAADPYAEN